MTFLAPLAGLVAGAIAGAVLLALYFLKLRRRPVRVSSTVLWQQAVEDLQVNTPFRWLRPTWLFVLQLLGLLALATAIGRPAIDLPRPAGSTILILIDRSASMSARDGRDAGGRADGVLTRLDEAKRRAAELADRLALQTVGGQGVLDRLLGGPAPRGLVAVFAHDARVIQPLTVNSGVLREAIETIGPSDQPGNLPAALELLEAFAPGRTDESDVRADTPTVFIFSDGGFASGVTPLRHGMDIRFLRVGPEPFTGNPADDAGPGNLGLVALNARRDFEDPATVRVFARAQNSAAEPVAALVRLSVDGVESDLVSVTLPAARTETVAGEARLTPGESPVNFRLTNTTGGVVRMAIAPASGEPDLLAADDVAALVLSRPRPPGVLVVTPAGETTLDPFLQSALADLPTTRLDPAGYAARVAGGRESLSAVDLVIFDRVTPAQLPPRASLSLGAGLPVPGLTVAEAGLPGTRVVGWRRGHPLLRGVPLDALIIDPPLAMTLPAGEGAPTVLAEGADGPLMALFDRDGPARVVLAFDLVRSNWGRDVSFPVFMAAALEFLTLRGQTQIGQWSSTTQPVRLRADGQAKEIVLEGPITRTIRPPAAAPTPEAGRLSQEGASVETAPLERTGVYVVRGTLEPAVAVNLADAQESTVWTSNSLPIAAAGGEGSWEGGGLRSTAASTPTGAPREVWTWFVLAALVLLSVEWLVFAARMRR